MNFLSEWASGIDLDWLIQKLCVVVAAVIALTVHESAHGLVAYRLGDDTAKRMGRISLNPLRHIDWVGLAMMIVAGFGWAKPVPINMQRFKNPKTGMAISAAAGPISNVLLALLSTVFYHLCFRAYCASFSDVWYYLSLFFLIAQAVNAGLAVFNLIPIPPLDGSKILAIILPDKAHDFLMQYERYGFTVLAALLFFGVLDTPLVFLQKGLISGLESFVSSFLPLM